MSVLTRVYYWDFPSFTLELLQKMSPFIYAVCFSVEDFQYCDCVPFHPPFKILFSSIIGFFP